MGEWVPTNGWIRSGNTLNPFFWWEQGDTSILLRRDVVGV